MTTPKPTIPSYSPGHAPLYEVTNVDYNNDILQLAAYLYELLGGTNNDKIPGTALAGGLALANSTNAQISLQVFNAASPGFDLAQFISVLNGHRSAIDKAGHNYHAQTTAPTLAAGTGMGTSPTGLSVTGSDQSGKIVFTSGTACPTFSNIFTLTFNQAYSNTPNAFALFPIGSTSGAYNIISANGLTTTGFTAFSGGTGLTASTLYQWYYIVS